LVTPIDKLDLQARLTIPYAKKTDFGRDDNQYLPEQGKSTLSYSFKAHYSVLSFNKQKIRKTQVGGSGNIAYVAHIPRTVRTSIQLTAGYDYLRTPSNYQIDLLSEMDTVPAMTGNFFHMNPAFGNLVFGISMQRKQSFGVSLDDEHFSFGSMLRPYFLLAANLSSSYDVYVLRSLQDDDTGEFTEVIEPSPNTTINNQVEFIKRMGIRLGVELNNVRPKASLFNSSSFCFEIGTLPYYQSGGSSSYSPK